LRTKKGPLRRPFLFLFMSGQIHIFGAESAPAGKFQRT